MKRMRKRRGFIWLSALLFIAVVVVATPSAALGSYAYNLTVLDPRGSYSGVYWTGAKGINDAGQVLGYVQTSPAEHSFVWDSGTYYDLGFLTHQGNCTYGCYNDTYANAINSSGQVSGYSWTTSAAQNAFIITPNYASPGSDGNPWFTSGGTSNYTRNAQMQDLQTSMPGTTTSSSAFGLNDAGEAVGWYQYTNTTTVNSAFLNSGGSHYDIGAGLNTPVAQDINNADQVTGDYKGGSNYLSFIWTDADHDNVVDAGEMKSSIGHLGGSVTRAQALNNEGQVVGYSQETFPGPYRAFIWEDDGSTLGDMTPLGVLDTSWSGARSYAYDINNHSQVVGSASTTSNDAGFVWRDGTITDLNTLIDPSTGFYVWSAEAINDKGWIVGNGYYTSSSSNRMLFILKPTGASMAFPMLPDPASPAGSYTYAAELTTGGAGDGPSADPIYLEAPIVAGMPSYEFIVAPGGSPLGDHLFTSVLIPAQGAGFLDDGDLLELFYGGSMYDLWVGTKYLLPNVSEFAIGGLDLSGAFPDSFLAGVTFNHASTADITITPYSGEYEGGGGTDPVPEPATLLLLGSGLAGLGLVRRRKTIHSEGRVNRNRRI